MAFDPTRTDEEIKALANLAKKPDNIFVRFVKNYITEPEEPPITKEELELGEDSL